MQAEILPRVMHASQTESDFLELQVKFLESCQRHMIEGSVGNAPNMLTEQRQFFPSIGTHSVGVSTRIVGVSPDYLANLIDPRTMLLPIL